MHTRQALGHTFILSAALGCGAGELESAPMLEDVSSEAPLELGSTAQALTNYLPEFPFTVLPVRFVTPDWLDSRCLEVQNASAARDASVVSNLCHSIKENQDWFLIRLKDNSYQIRPGHAGGRLLSIRNAATGPLVGAGQTYDILASANARWEIVPSGNKYLLKNVNSQLCLNQMGDQVACDANAALQLQPKYQFPFSITAKHSGMCLNVAGASTANNANVQQYPCVGAENERWSLQPNDSLNPSYYEFRAAHSNKCLDIAGGSLANNGNAQQYACTGVTNERWTVHSAGEGYFYIKNVNSGKCLTVAGASTSSNANVDQYTCVNADNQKWRWNYFIEKHVEWVIAKDANGTGTDITSTQFTNNFNVAQRLFAPYGVNLVHSSATDRVTVNAAAHFYGVNDSVATWCPKHQTTHRPDDCAASIAAEYPGKVVVISTQSRGGASSGDQPVTQIAGNGYGDICKAPAVVDVCGSANDNVAHVAHELGHFFGLPHASSGADDDWLADTATDNTSDICDSRRASPPAIGDNVMSYHVPCTAEISPSQGAILKTAAYARYSDGVR